MPVRMSAAQPESEQARLEQMQKELASSVSPKASFANDPLALTRRPSSERFLDGSADGEKKVKVVYSAVGQRREQPLTLGDDGRVSVSVTRRQAPESRLELTRTPFSGGENTLPYMDADPAPEVSLQYQLRDNAAARLTFNPQDPSPLYRPAESSGRINTTGVYMDVDLASDLRLQVGGEYHEIEKRDAQAGVAQGAAVSLQWNF